MQGELGIHLKNPSQNNLLTADESLVFIMVKRGDEIMAMATWAIFITGKWSSDLSIERLD